MTREGKKTSAVGQHPHKPAQQAHIAQGIQLIDHTVFLVHEPPSASPLHFTCNTTIIEISNHGSKGFIVRWIQIIQDGFG